MHSNRNTALRLDVGGLEHDDSSFDEPQDSMEGARAAFVASIEDASALRSRRRGRAPRRSTSSRPWWRYVAVVTAEADVQRTLATRAADAASQTDELEPQDDDLEDAIERKAEERP
jgi:hypothetical protein